VAERIPYGTDPFQFGELTVPVSGGPHPVAIVIHGGFWRAKYDLAYIRPVCNALADRGIAAWNMEYRRIGNAGGGWRGTFDDVSAGADHLESIGSRYHLDLNRRIVMGHSAGGHLAFWLAAEKRSFVAAISLAGVVDLRRAWELHLSNNVVLELLGGDPNGVPERFAFASPIERLPIGIPQKLFHGTKDENVPIEISERYVRVAQDREDAAELIRLEGSGHFELVDVRTKEFAMVLDAASEQSQRGR
jgi:dipeptidyl aminopeptidase/acylaminoacyl peptidase